MSDERPAPSEASEPDTAPSGSVPGAERAPNFVADLVDDDLRAGKHDGRVATRFPPEPNGYLHIGHAKSICLNFGIAAKSAKGTCNLRFDDTNPATEETEYVDSIRADVRWLGFDWGEREHFASDYFDRLYAIAEQLVEDGLAYVDSQSTEEIRKGRGSFYEKGKESPFRDRSVAENLALLRKMRGGELPDGSHVLRAKIDMGSADINMRDPLLYRIKHAHHHRTGDRWCIYPMYDYAHPLSDAIEGITHSICTLEFEDHRPLYDWFVANARMEHRPRQIEFARLNLTYTVLSKRRLQELVEGGHVRGWDDPRMPTLAGLRRRGYTPEALRAFCDRIGVSKKDGVVDVALLEHTLREDLNARAPRAMGVLRPLRLVIDNWPEGHVERFSIANHPEDPSYGTREVPFSRVVYIERDDFAEVPPKKWFRLQPGGEIRLRGACIVRCNEVVKDAAGAIVELRCTWDEGSRGGAAPDNRRIKGTSHWVSAEHALDAEVRLYDRLFSVENPSDEKHGKPYTDLIDPASLEVLTGCKLEPSLAAKKAGEPFQLERLGYFVVDPDGTPERPVLNRTIGLKDSYAKIAGKT
ncbi:MAG: glutamine--tRNA ligase/YqeY domain fusion protein [Deltaproteobacteria bacterium]|nr:glutamine--tRNA ligase/YqeY domain fusion protein [Deltaproteobacteria bacterium]